MSKNVRLPDYLATEVERLAQAENRSLANMVKVLLEQSLNLEKSGFGRIMDGDEPVGMVIPEDPPATVLVRKDDPHFKPDPK